MTPGLWIYFIAVLSVIGYAFQPPLAKVLNKELQPFTIMAINAFITLIIHAVCAWRYELEAIKTFNIAATKQIAVSMGLYSFCSAFAGFLFFISIKKMDVVHYELIYTLCPLFAAGIAYLLLGEEFKLKYILSFILVSLAAYIAVK